MAACSPRKQVNKGSKLLMAKKNRNKRHSRVEIATTQADPQSETADRTRGESEKIAELELENLRLRQLVIDLLLWDD
jgi:hypothetical protein